MRARDGRPKGWAQREQELWNEMMYPRRRKITAHSVPQGPDREKILRRIDEAREREFAAGWRAYEAWMGHTL